jgi:excisionase family DNA binding protein
LKRAEWRVETGHAHKPSGLQPTPQVEIRSAASATLVPARLWRNKSACAQYLLVSWFSGLLRDLDSAFSADAQTDQRSVAVTADRSSIDVMAEFGILQANEVAELLKLRQSTVLDLSRRGILPAFKIGKHWRYRRADLIDWIANRGDDA